MTTVTEPNGATVTYVYDADGELTDTTDQDGRRTTYSYNADGDQTGETWLSGGTTLDVITYTYDADNELTGAADSYATLTFTYDSGGNQTLGRDLRPGHRPAQRDADLHLRPGRQRAHRQRQPVERRDRRPTPTTPTSG